MCLFLGLMFFHWIADFILQTEHMAKRKSVSNYYLGYHVVIYTTASMILWLLLFTILGRYYSILGYILAYLTMFILHFSTDYVTSRITSRLHKENKIHNFFVVIGLDQWLHYVQIYITYIILINI